jgi:hypothetical protein
VATATMGGTTMDGTTTTMEDAIAGTTAATVAILAAAVGGERKVLSELGHSRHRYG